VLKVQLVRYTFIKNSERTSDDFNSSSFEHAANYDPCVNKNGYRKILGRLTRETFTMM
jgi:hypothetical protein